MPDSWPDYPHHSQVLAYLERYADHFGLREHIWFGTEVAGSSRPTDGRLGRDHQRGPRRRLRPHPALRRRAWWPTGTTGRRSCPTYEGLADFRGEVIHAAAYKDAAQLRGKQGAGGRRRQHRLRHRGRGGPAGGPVLALHPPRLLVRARSTSRPPGRPGQRPRAARCGCRCGCASGSSTARCGCTVGDLTRFGLPEPDHGLRDPPDRQQPARLLRRPRRDHPGAGRRPVRPRRGRAHRRADRSSRTWSCSPPGTCRGSSSSPRSCSMWTLRAGRGCYLHAFSPRPPDAGRGRAAAARLGRVLARALADRRDRHAGCGCASTAPTRAAAFWRRHAAEAGQPVQPGQGQAVDPALVRGRPRRVPAGGARGPCDEMEAAA